jgi:hypothetical protein
VHVIESEDGFGATFRILPTLTSEETSSTIEESTRPPGR